MASSSRQTRTDLLNNAEKRLADYGKTSPAPQTGALQEGASQEVPAAKQDRTRHRAQSAISDETAAKLRQLSREFEESHPLDRSEQKKRLEAAKGLLESIDPHSVDVNQQSLVATAKERVGHLERALSLMGMNSLDKSATKKTALGLAGLAVCLTAIGALISLLVKLDHSASVAEEDDTENPPLTDQTEAIQGKQHDIEAQQQAIEGLEAQKQELVEQGANLPEEQIRREAEMSGFREAVNKNEVVYDNTDDGVKNPKPSLEGKQTIEKFVNQALAEHHEKQSHLNDIESKIKAAEDHLGSLQEEKTALRVDQGRYEKQQETTPLAAKIKSIANNPTKTETAILSSLGIGAFSMMGAASGLFAVNSSKALPKLKRNRANQQASQSSENTAQANQPEAAPLKKRDLITPPPTRRHTLP